MLTVGLAEAGEHSNAFHRAGQSVARWRERNFNGRFRDECLIINRELLGSVLEAQVIARGVRDEYNTIRPHSTIGYKLPVEFRAELLRQAPGSGQARKAGPPSAQSLPVFPSAKPTLTAINNLPRLSSRVVQKSESGQLSGVARA